MRVYLKKPNGKRKSYALYIRDGKKNTTMENAQLDALNRSNLDPDIKLKNALEIKKQVEAKLGLRTEVVFNDENERILNEFMKEKYGTREVIDQRTARYEFERVIKALDKLSIASATPLQLVDKVRSHGWSNTKRRRILKKLQILLNFLGRPVKLTLPPKEESKVAFINESDFKTGMKRIDDEWERALFETLFYTGMRLGEAFALNELKIRKDHIYVDSQVDIHGKLRHTKNRKSRRAFVPKSALPIVRRWLQLKDQKGVNRVTINKHFKKIFPHLTIHDLRHSYAIRLLSKGVPMAHVAQSLGNSVRVCEEYYVGYELSDESIELIKKLVN